MTIKIGVMDSGSGGMTILSALHTANPSADFLYFADQAHAPYGLQEPAFIVQRLKAIAAFFIAQGCQLMVVACNTATVAGIQELRQTVDIPVVGVEPAVKPACSASVRKRVTVLATEGTSKSKRLLDLIDTWRFDAEVAVLPNRVLASLIDRMPMTFEDVQNEVSKVALQIIDNQSDTLVLACTHYPLVLNLFSAALPNVAIVEPSKGVSAQVSRLIERNHLSVDASHKGVVQLCVNQHGEALTVLDYWAENDYCPTQYVSV